MKIVVVFKWSKNPQDARINAEAVVDWRGVKMAVNDDDPAAMELAVNLADGGEVIAVTAGDGDTAWAAARGAMRTVVVSDAKTDVDSFILGNVLADAIRRIENVDAVIIGDSAWDYGVVSALAGQLGYTAIAGVTAAETGAEGLRITRRVGSTAQVLSVQGPVLLAVTASRGEKNAPGMREILAARKKPVEKLTLAELGAYTSAANSTGTRFPDTPPARIIDGSNPTAACEELMNALRADGVL